MAGAMRFEHGLLRVKELDKAVEFYTNVMNLTEIAREDGIVYLGCGLDGNYDLAVTEGGSGLSRFAFRVDSEEDIQRYEKRLKEHYVPFERIDGREPGLVSGIRFTLPCKTPMELKVVEDNRYFRPYDPPVLSGRSSITPLDADHITICSMDVKKDVEFLQQVLGYYVSDVTVKKDGTWQQVFVRHGSNHHDIAITNVGNPQHTLHHYALTAANIEHLKLFSDRLSQCGYQLETGINRHWSGSNLFIYFREPGGGNRIELSCEMATISPNTPTRFNQMDGTFTPWGGLTPPPSFSQGT